MPYIIMPISKAASSQLWQAKHSNLHSKSNNRKIEEVSIPPLLVLGSNNVPYKSVLCSVKACTPYLSIFLELKLNSITKVDG